MKTVCKINECVGCKACINICKKDAITLVDDKFKINAVINEDKCIDCRACSRVCQQTSTIDLDDIWKWRQGWSNDRNIRTSSSSGGIASSLAIQFIREGGCVFGCTVNNKQFGFMKINKEEDVKKMAGSKYVKSDPGSVYEQVKKELRLGQKVMFVGLPCQVYALKKYVGDKYTDNLLLIDLICHGSPSNKLLEQYLYEHNISNFSDIIFRVKSNYNEYSGYRGLTPDGIPDKYMFAFIKGLSFTENCYNCSFAGIKRCSDITLGDSWGSDLDKENQDMGISLVLIQTPKGEAALMKSDVFLTNVNKDLAIKANSQLNYAMKNPYERKRFINYLEKGMSFDRSVEECYKSFFIKQKIKQFLMRLGVYSSKKNSKYRLKVMD